MRRYATGASTATSSGVPAVRGDLRVDLLFEHLDDLHHDRVRQVQVRRRGQGRRELRAVRVLQQQPATGEVQAGAADVVGVLLGHDDREIVTVLHQVRLAGLVHPAEVHVVGERRALDPADLEPQGEGLRLRLTRPDLQDPLPGRVGDREQGGELGHVDNDTPMTRELPLVPTTTYRAPDKVAVRADAHRGAGLGVEVAADDRRTGPARDGLDAAMCEDVATALVEPRPGTRRWSGGSRRTLHSIPPVRAALLATCCPRSSVTPASSGRAKSTWSPRSRPRAGCAHRCRHCPVPVVDDGRIQINDVDAVVADVAQQVAMGARHVSYGDPDFFNGVHHALRAVRAVHDRFPELTFDCTVKVEHILKHAHVWEELAASGCLFVVSRVRIGESHHAAAARQRPHRGPGGTAVVLLRTHGIAIRPSWLPFTPWATLDDVRAILEFVAEHDLVGNVDPVQYTIRLLVPERSLLLGHIDGLGPWDASRLTYPWTSPLDPLQARFAALWKPPATRSIAGRRRVAHRGRPVAARAHRRHAVAPPQRALVLLRRTHRVLQLRAI